MAELRSDNAQVRSDALEQLRSDPVALRDPRVKAALIRLLDRENRVRLSADNEGYAEYLSWLSDTVAKIVDWSDPRQVCILSRSIDPPQELAEHAKVGVPCLLQRLKSGPDRNAPDPNLSRGAVVAMLVRALAKGKNEIDPGTTIEVQDVVRNALHDPNANIRGYTVEALKKFGGEDMIPALKEVADKDPDSSHDYGLRKSAAAAIAAIESRASQR